MERIVTATLRVSLGVDGRAKEGGGGWGNKNLTNLTLLTMYYKQHYLVPPPSPPTKYTVKTIREGISSLEHLPFRPQHHVPVLSFRLQLEKLTNPAIDLESHTEQLDIDKRKITRNRKIA